MNVHLQHLYDRVNPDGILFQFLSFTVVIAGSDFFWINDRTESCELTSLVISQRPAFLSC